MAPVAAEKIREILLGGRQPLHSGARGFSILESCFAGDFCIYKVLDSWGIDRTLGFDANLTRKVYENDLQESCCSLCRVKKSAVFLATQVER
jgi:hypothetical protein